MRKCLVLVAFLTTTLSGHAATELQVGLLPSFLERVGSVALLRADATLLVGSDFFLLGPYASFEGVSPQGTDTSLGGALRIGHESYLELETGYFQRVLTQSGTGTMTGKGFSGSIVYGLHLSPNLGVSVALTGKRIASGTLDARWIVDLLPLFTMRVEF